MDVVYAEQPILLLFPILLSVWQIVCCRIKKKRALSTFVDALMTVVGVVGHAVGITVILLSGGALSDALLLVLLSGALGLSLSPKPTDPTKGESR